MMKVRLRQTLAADSLQVMNFLNEVVSQYPDAISLAPGRPWEDFFRVESAVSGIARYVERTQSGGDLGATFDRLGQYGRTNGFAHTAIAEHLARDCQISVEPEAIMITSGCQEAMLIALLGLFEPGVDALLCSDPTYIGITGLATMLGIDVVTIPAGDNGLDPDAVARAVAQTQELGKRPRALYDIPDFNNPLGTCMPIAARLRLLDIAHDNDILVFEDNPYGMFAYDEDYTPPLKALDEHGVVVYFGSFSKTLFPGLRLGYLVADQPVAGDQGANLADALSLVKSLTTVNTSPLLQAALVQILVENQHSLRARIEEKRAFYRRNRDCTIGALERHFAGIQQRVGSPLMRWNHPRGGFFVAVQLPCVFDAKSAAACARDYGVICAPMSFFSLRGDREQEVRLSFSHVTPDEIDEGVARLARFVAQRGGY